MSDISGLDRRFVGINRISEAGPSGKFWPVVFLGGCNLRCPYCLNSEIVEPSGSTKYIPLDEIIARLDEWWESGVMISGGEPCMPHPSCGIIEVVKALSGNGRKVGVSTNGSWPGELNDLLLTGRVSYVALDCKTSPLRCPSSVSSLGGPEDLLSRMGLSMFIVQKWHDRHQNVMSEIRTTLYPPLVGQYDIRKIGMMIPRESTWVLQQYRKHSAFGSAEVEPYSEEKVKELFALAKSVRGFNVEMRWP